MSGRVVAVLAGSGLLAAGALLYLLRVAYLRFEVLYDRPQGEAEVFRFQVWLPPFLHFQVRRQSAAGGGKIRTEPRRNWSTVLARGWTVVREIRVVQRTLASLLRHELGFLEEDRSLRGGVRFLVRVLERVRWHTEELSWVTRLGAGDAALTGMLCGLLWGFKGAAFGVLARRMTFATEPVVRVLPDFESVAFRTTFRCIVRVRVGDIIGAGAAVWRGKRGAAWRTNTRLKV